MKDRPVLMSAPMVRASLAGNKTQSRRIVKPQPASVSYKLHGEKSDRIHGMPTMMDGKGQGWGMCGPFKCPFIGDGMYAGEKGLLKNSLTGDDSDRKSLLWVRETFALENTSEYDGKENYPVDGRPIQNHAGHKIIPRYRATEPDTHLIIKDNVSDEYAMRWTPSIFMPRWASRITLEVEAVRVERLQDISEEDAKAEGIDVVRDEWSGACGDFDESLTDIQLYKILWESINGPCSWEKNPWVWVVSFTRCNTA